VGVEQHSVVIVVELGGDILHKELHLVDEVACCLGSLGGGCLACLFVVRLDPFFYVNWLDLGHIESGSEGGLLCQFWVVVTVVEQLLQGGGGQVLPFLVYFSEDDCVHHDILLKGLLFSLLVIGHLSTHFLR
jgi:hypothetical protein